jgi:hypothetical protein
MKPSFNPQTNIISGCKPYTFIWWHEKGHQNQFSYNWVRQFDKKIYKYKLLYWFWNQFLEIDANLYAVFKWLKFKVA